MTEKTRYTPSSSLVLFMSGLSWTLTIFLLVYGLLKLFWAPATIPFLQAHSFLGAFYITLCIIGIIVGAFCGHAYWDAYADAVAREESHE